jgi:outer membrane receptor protein involved in Fe transport
MKTQLTSLGLAILASTMPLTADETPDENILVITADYRTVSIDEATTSVSLLSEETLKDAAEQHLEEVVNLIPNINWAGGSSRPRYFQIRGIGELDGYEGAPNPSVAMIIDDIDFSSLGMLASLFDVSQVEVLRGPQSARYGANAIAGMINIRTRDPRQETELRSQLMLGDYDTSGAAVSVSGSLVDDNSVLGLVSINQYYNNGFRENPFLGRDDTNEKDELTLRAKLNWQASNQSQLKLTLINADFDNGYDAFALDNTYRVLSDKPGKDSQKTSAFAGRWDYSGDSVDIAAIITQADVEAEQSFDGDWGNPEFWGDDGPYDFTSDNDRERTTNTQEVRLLSKPASMPGEMDWVAGIYRQDLAEDNQIVELFNGFEFRDFNSAYDAETIAIYAQGHWLLSETTDMSVSMRRERRDARYTDSNRLLFTPTDTMTGGDLSIRHSLSEHLGIWGSVSRGYKAGGFNLSLSVPDALRQYDPEYLWNYEIGLRGQSADNQFRWSVSLFEMDREDVQISTSQQADPNDPLTFIFLTDNAAQGNNRGLEMDASWQLNSDWSLSGSLGYLDTVISSYDSADQALVGREQAHAPNYMMALALSYQNEYGWFGRLEWNARDEFYYSFSHQQIAPSTRQVHFKAGYEMDNWSYYIWGRNLTDEYTTVRGFFFSNEPPFEEPKLYERLGDPRHIGVTIRYQY